MVAPQTTQQQDEDVQKQSYNELEHHESADLKKLPHVEGVDQFGGHRKIDPAEIALVKRLDMFMLVSLPRLQSCDVLSTDPNIPSPSYGSCICSTTLIAMPLSMLASTVSKMILA